MKTIFMKTLSGMFKPVIAGIYFGLTFLVSLIFIILRFDKTSISLITDSALSVVIFMFFLIQCGIISIITITLTGSGMFATEEAEGTMRILASKPIKRSSIVTGKLLGVATGSFIYMITSTVLTLTSLGILSGIDVDVFKLVISKMPSTILYGIFIIFFFLGVSGLLSTIFKKKIPAIIIIIVYLLLSFGVFPIVRNIMTSYGENKYSRFKIYLVDTNYHLGAIYSSILNTTGNIELSDDSKQLIGVFTGMYIAKTKDLDLMDNSNNYPYTVATNNTINNNLLLIIYSLTAITCYAFTYIRMERKDIN